MRHKINIAGRVYNIDCCDTTCDANQWGWDCEFVEYVAGEPVCRLFRVRLRKQNDGHPYRAQVCMQSEVAPPTIIGGGGFNLGRF